LVSGQHGRRSFLGRYGTPCRLSSLSEGRPDLSHASFLITFGLFGAVVMSIPGTWVQAALGE
jgi:hypothetical protein